MSDEDKQYAAEVYEARIQLMEALLKQGLFSEQWLRERLNIIDIGDRLWTK